MLNQTMLLTTRPRQIRSVGTYLAEDLLEDVGEFVVAGEHVDVVVTGTGGDGDELVGHHVRSDTDRDHASRLGCATKPPF